MKSEIESSTLGLLRNEKNTSFSIRTIIIIKLTEYIYTIIGYYLAWNRIGGIVYRMVPMAPLA